MSSTFSFKYRGKELDYYDKEIECTSPHLLDSVHWCNPAENFPNHIKQSGEYFITTSRGEIGLTIQRYTKRVLFKNSKTI